MHFLTVMLYLFRYNSVTVEYSNEAVKTLYCTQHRINTDEETLVKSNQSFSIQNLTMSGSNQLSARFIERSLMQRFLSKSIHVLGRFIRSSLIYSSDPKVVWKRDRQGLVYLQAYDPRTNSYHYFSSEQDVRIWIEQRYQK